MRGILNFPCCQLPHWSPNCCFTFSIHGTDVPFLLDVRALHTILLFVSVSLSCVYTSRGARHAEVIGQIGQVHLSPSCITLSFFLAFLVLYARVAIIRHHVRLSAPDMFSPVDSLRNKNTHFSYLADCSHCPPPPFSRRLTSLREVKIRRQATMYFNVCNIHSTRVCVHIHFWHSSHFSFKQYL